MTFPKHAPKRALRWVALLALLLAALAPGLARADALDDQTYRVARQLQCPVCEGQTVADSNSGLAADMRGAIRSKLAAGESEQQILDFFVQAYGESILSDPPKRGSGLGVWLGPVLGIGLGLFFLAAFVSRMSRPARAAAAPAARLDGAVLDEMSRFRQEYDR